MQRNVIVTGGGSGIGLEVGKQLRDLGFRVITIDLPEKVRPSDDAIAADLSVSAAADAAIDECVKRLGRIDSAVNAAGVFGPMASVEAISDQQLDDVTFRNIRICLFALRAELRHMQRQRGGRIVNVASVAGSHGIVYKGDYCAAKHAILGLTKAAALENVKLGIAVNGVSPGFVDTPMTALAIRDNPMLEGFIAKQTPLGRSTSASAVASLIRWLATEAPLDISGADYVIDGCYGAR
jgi:NAD(P)-dependent dehydrogenase (short-subunit alcohol dehydrogenase family)